MTGKANAGGVLGLLNVTCAIETTVTLTKPGYAVTFTKTGTNLSFKLPMAGDWTMTSVQNGLTQTRTVTLTAGVPLTVEPITDIMLYNRGVYATGFASGWSSGEGSGSVSKTGGPYMKPRGYAKSTGSVNLSEFETVQFEYSSSFNLGYYANGDFGFEVVRAGTDTVLASWTAPRRTYGNDPLTTQTIDVSSINEAVNFRIWADGYSGGGEQAGGTCSMTLYSVKVISTN